MTWTPPPPPETGPFGPMGWLRVVVLGGVLAVVVLGGLALLLALRLVERPVAGTHRPVSPWITVAVCRAALALLGVRVTQRGRPSPRGAVVANHTSWLDIFVLNSTGPLYFVSKSEVAGWPLIGWLARATGTLFIARDRRQAAAQTRAFAARLAQGHRMVVFPEGTSTDGQRVLPFKTTLFAAFYADTVPADMRVQAVSVAYTAPRGQRAVFYGWWGDMDFAPSLIEMLATPAPGAVHLTWHTPRRVAEHGDRKALARALEGDVRSTHPHGSAGAGISSA